jgi:hypothetical protein
MSFVSYFSSVLRWPDLFVGAVDGGGYDDWNVSSVLVSLSDEKEVHPAICS